MSHAQGWPTFGFMMAAAPPVPVAELRTLSSFFPQAPHVARPWRSAGAVDRPPEWPPRGQRPGFLHIPSYTSKYLHLRGYPTI